LWLLFAFPLRRFPFGEFGWFGTKAQIAGLVTLFIPYVFAIVGVRVLLLEPHQEECAEDLGASPTQALRRVVLPQIGPAVVAAAAVVFSGALSEFVVSRSLFSTNDTRTLAMALFGALGGPSPRHSAIGTTLALAGALSVVALVLAFRGAGRRAPHRAP
jgi:spermidine/putrescine transport system permease protein